METVCKIDFYLKEVGVEETLPLATIAGDDPVVTLHFVFNGDMDWVRNRPMGFFEFSIAFDKWFEENKKTVINGIGSIIDIETPSFYAHDDGLVGVSRCVPEDVYVEILVSWDRVKIDFQEWFGRGDFDLNDDFDSIQDLYDTIRDRKDGALFKVEVSPSGGLSISAPGMELPKIKLNEDERVKAMQFLDSLYELTIDGEASFRHDMEKND